MISKNEFKNILEDYKPDDSIFNEEPEITNQLKHIIYNDLDEVDRRCILLYCELGSLRKLGTELHVSASSAYLKIKSIKEKINAKLNTAPNPNTDNNGLHH